MPAPDQFDHARAAKMARLRPFLRDDLPHVWRDGRVDYLTDALRQETRMVDTENVSAFGYDADMAALIDRHRDGLVLDCGAGSKSDYRPNVVCLEIVAYPFTDVLAVGEHLPFADTTFDAVLSVAVLEHVRDPFRCAAEIARVLKPGGELFCVMPLLQPLHGFPHHHFNATSQGLARLFEEAMTDLHVAVPAHGLPLFALSWMLSAWAKGLPPDERDKFLAMRVGDLAVSPEAALNWVVHHPVCTELDADRMTELASGHLLTARRA